MTTTCVSTFSKKVLVVDPRPNRNPAGYWYPVDGGCIVRECHESNLLVVVTNSRLGLEAHATSHFSRRAFVQSLVDSCCSSSPFRRALTTAFTHKRRVYFRSLPLGPPTIQYRSAPYRVVRAWGAYPAPLAQPSLFNAYVFLGGEGRDFMCIFPSVGRSVGWSVGFRRVCCCARC